MFQNPSLHQEMQNLNMVTVDGIAMITGIETITVTTSAQISVMTDDMTESRGGKGAASVLQSHPGCKRKP